MGTPPSSDARSPAALCSREAHVVTPVRQTELLVDPLQRVGHRKVATVFLDPRQEYTLEDEIADLAAERFVIVAVDGIENFVSLFEHEASQ